MPSNIKFKPLSNFVVVDAIERKPAGGLVLPDGVRNPSFVSIIVVATSDEKDEKGNPMVKNVKVGDKVSLNPHQIEYITIYGKEYGICREGQIHGIMTGTDEDEDEAIAEAQRKGNAQLKIVKPNMKIN